jgi:hypothetical protein
MDKKVTIVVIMTVSAIAVLVVLLSIPREKETIQKKEQTTSPTQKEIEPVKDTALSNTVTQKEKKKAEPKEETEQKGERITGPLVN